MELNYNITEQDFIDYNLFFVEHDKAMQKMLNRNRYLGAGIVLLGGFALMILMKSLTPVSAVLYIALAAAVYFVMPRFYRSSITKHVRRTIHNAKSKSICGPKTLTVTEDSVNLRGEEENSTYQFSAFTHTAEGPAQIYLYLDDLTALIVPFSAFADETARRDFMEMFERRIQSAKA